MDMIDVSRFIISLLFVLLLILFFAWIVKKSGLERRFHGQKSDKARLEVLDRLMLDPRRKLVLIRRDNREHLVLLGATQELLIESYDHIPQKTSAETD